MLTLKVRFSHFFPFFLFSILSLTEMEDQGIKECTLYMSFIYYVQIEAKVSSNVVILSTGPCWPLDIFVMWPTGSAI